MANVDMTSVQKQQYLAHLANIATDPNAIPLSPKDFLNTRYRGKITKRSNEEVGRRQIAALRLGPLHR